MNFISAIVTCVRKSRVFQGRAGRAEFWYWFLFCCLAELASLIAVGSYGGAHPDPDPASGWIAISWVVATSFLLSATMAVAARRLHDVNFSAWWLLSIFCLVGIPLVLVFAALPGSPESNQYGEPPGDKPQQQMPSAERRPSSSARRPATSAPDTIMARIAELDHALAWWDSAIGRSGDSVKTLLDDSRWDLLAGLGDAFAGQTKRNFDAGRAAAERLRKDLSQLEAVLAQARALRPKAERSPAALDQAFALLEGASVQSAPEELPLNERSLLGPSSVSAARRPKAVLAEMETDFATATGALTKIYAGWSDARQRRDRLLADIDALREVGADETEATALREAAVAATNAELADPLDDHRMAMGAIASRLGQLRQRAVAAVAQDSPAAPAGA